MRPEKLYLTDIVDAAEAIAGFIADAEVKEFNQDQKTQSAVLQKLIVIGEAASRLSDDFKTRHPAEVEW